MKTIKFISNNLLLWVILAAVIAFFWPQIFIPLAPYNSWFFSLTMFGIGMVLEIKDFKNILLQPKAVLIGTAAQYVIMPFSAFFVAKVFHLPPEIGLGLILTGAAPGAMTSNLISYLAGADVAYSISLTTASTLLSPILTPLLTLWLGGYLLKVSFWPMFISIINMIIVPLILGFLLKHFFNKKIKSFIEVFPALSVVAIALICGIVVALNQSALTKLSGSIFGIVFLLNFMGIVLAYYWAKAAKLNNLRVKTLVIEVSMQNAGLGVALALKHFSPVAALPSALFTIWCIISASILVKIWKQYKY